MFNSCNLLSNNVVFCLLLLPVRELVVVVLLTVPYKSYYYYPRDAVLARVIAIATCLSVRLSRAGIVSKRRKLAPSGMISSPSGSPKTLVF